jgi:hypothetical protein
MKAIRSFLIFFLLLLLSGCTPNDAGNSGDKPAGDSSSRSSY